MLKSGSVYKSLNLEGSSWTFPDEFCLSMSQKFVVEPPLS